MAITALFAVAVNDPLASLFDAPGGVSGTPPIFIYIFGVWTAFVALMALTMRKRRPPRS